MAAKNSLETARGGPRSSIRVPVEAVAPMELRTHDCDGIGRAVLEQADVDPASPRTS